MSARRAWLVAGTLSAVAAVSNLDPARFASFRHAALTDARSESAAPDMVRLEYHAEDLR